MYGLPHLAILNREYVLAHMHLRKAHQVDHEETMSMLHRSRREVWIIEESTQKAS